MVYGTTFVLLYTISMLYHSLCGLAKSLFQRPSYRAIYLVIVGSYTPFALVTLYGPQGRALFGINWALVAIGIAQGLRIGRHTHLFSLLIYVVMGWLVPTAVESLAVALPTPGLWQMVAGGVLYTADTAFFLLNEKVRHFHGIWHLSALAGSVC